MSRKKLTAEEKIQSALNKKAAQRRAFLKWQSKQTAAKRAAKELADLARKMAVTKICCCCEEEKPVEEFSKNAGSVDALQSRCKICAAAASLSWQRHNRARHNAWNRARYAAKKLAAKEKKLLEEQE